MKRVSFIVLCLIIILPHLVEAGIVVEKVNYSKTNPAEKEKTITYISRNRIKVVESDGNYELWDLNKGTLFMVNPHQKSYAGGVMIEEFIREMREMKEGIRKMQQEMGMSPEKFPPEIFPTEPTPPEIFPTEPTPKEKVTVKNTGQVTTIAGYTATKYAIYRDGRLDSEVWVAPKLEAEIEKEVDYKKFEKLARKFERALEAEFGPSYVEEEETTELDLLYEKGYEVKEIDYYFNDVTEVTNVKKMDIPEMEFILPGGYKKVSAQEFMESEEEEE